MPLHNKFVTIVGDKEKFDPLFNYEFQRKFENIRKNENEENLKEKEETEEDKKNFEEKNRQNDKQAEIINFEKEIPNFKILNKRNKKQNIRKTPNSYYSNFMSKSGYAKNSNSFAEKNNSNFHEISGKEFNKENVSDKNYLNKNFYNTANKIENETNNKNRTKEFMTVEVNDAKINNLRKHQQEEFKEAYFGRRTTALDELVKNKRTYIEEFSVFNFKKILILFYSNLKFL